jgi:2-(1,2-epoxy-1,2-dihydrophenyl)acetyl-CoA isomerase
MTTPAPGPIVVSRQHDVATIRFSRPAVLNAIDLETARAFAAAVDDVTADDRVRVVVLAAEGQSFIAGGDLGYFRAAADRPAAAEVLIAAMHAPLIKLAQDKRPVLASLKGAVAGGGVGVALMADLAIAADDVRFNLAYVAVAASPDCGSTWNLVHLVGLRKAMELALLGNKVDAAEALRLGLVNRVVPRAELDGATESVARRLAGQSPLALARTKALLRAAVHAPLAAQLDAEKAAFAAGAATADFAEALDAFFAKRKPVFGGR